VPPTRSASDDAVSVRHTGGHTPRTPKDQAGRNGNVDLIEARILALSASKKHRHPLAGDIDLNLFCSANAGAIDGCRRRAELRQGTKPGYFVGHPANRMTSLATRPIVVASASWPAISFNGTLRVMEL